MDGGAVLVGFLAFLGVILAPIATGFLDQKRERRIARHDYIQSVIDRLIDLRAELQYYQLPEWHFDRGEVPFSDLATSPEFRLMQIAFGKAYAIMISVDIKEIRDRASDVMATVTPDVKLDAIDFALKRLGEEVGFFEV